VNVLEQSSGWELVVYERQQRRVFRLPDSGPVTIGRAPRCDVRLEDDSVSREHARLHLPSLELEDLDSRNGSWLVERAGDAGMSELLEAAPARRLLPGERHGVRPGAVVKLGTVVCQIERSAPVTRTLPAGVARESEAPVLEDRSMIELYALAERGAATALPLLILGETGVGKSVLAARIHRASACRDGPFVRINCGALSESLLESALFGHQLGAFAGANEDKAGVFELGDGGSVFLDEIGELPLSTQARLLRVLETNHVTRIGEATPRRIDVRFIAATNRELAGDMQLGAFRKDLYFRINTLCLKVKPLRERRPDILPLVRHFLHQTCASTGVSVPQLSPEVAQHLEQYHWPGNVRELKNAVERARLLCGNGPLLLDHFPTERDLVNRAPNLSDIWAEGEAPTRVSAPVDEVVVAPDSGQAALLDALNSCGGNQTRAAQLLGISRRTLVNRLNRLNLPRPRKGR